MSCRFARAMPGSSRSLLRRRTAQGLAGWIRVSGRFSELILSLSRLPHSKWPLPQEVHRVPTAVLTAAVPKAGALMVCRLEAPASSDGHRASFGEG
jgi:hypothetical protein